MLMLYDLPFSNCLNVMRLTPALSAASFCVSMDDSLYSLNLLPSSDIISGLDIAVVMLFVAI